MEPSGVITFVTDFGLGDPYVAMMKGVVLSINPECRLIDVTHQIGAGSILQAAGIIRETFSFFPEGTVHVAVVDPGVGGPRRLIGVEANGHFFVGPDNGVFWPVVQDSDGAMVRQLMETKFFLQPISSTFHGREIFAPVAAHLSLGVDLKSMGPIVKAPVKLDFPVPREREGVLYGQIIRVDNFGNLITNIHSKKLARFLQTSQPVVELGRLTIKKLSKAYSDAEEGEPLALVNSSNWLEIAVNLGRASEYIGMDLEETVGAVIKVSKSEGSL